MVTEFLYIRIPFRLSLLIAMDIGHKPFSALNPGDNVLGDIQADARAQACAGSRPDFGKVECPVCVHVDARLRVLGHGGYDVRRWCKPVFWMAVQNKHRPEKQCEMRLNAHMKTAINMGLPDKRVRSKIQKPTTSEASIQKSMLLISD